VNETDSKYGKVLIVDDDVDILHAAKLLLKRHVELIHTESDPESLPTLLKNESYDVILLDMNFTKEAAKGEEGFYWLDRILEIDPSAAVVLITAFGDVDIAVRAMKEGATDFILKPWQNERLVATVMAAMRLRESRDEADHLRFTKQQLSEDIDHRFKDFIGNSPKMEQVFNTISKVADTDANILILGENGTGKELVARSLHRQSQRANEVFISVDMGAISETLFESELFGYVKGAFTDAKKDKPGRFEVASGGTLFLDEIGNLSLPLQAKLLTTLESRQVTRVGSTKPIPIDVRLICATNMTPADMVAQQRFRQDLLYRINTVEIHLPPLRERQGDIPLLVEHFLDQYCKKYQKNIKRVSEATLKKLDKYHWPGNIRELQHAVERAVILSETDVLQPIDFPLSQMDAEDDIMTLNDYNLDRVEKTVIRKVMSQYEGNVSQAAEELGLTRAALYRRLEKYNL